MTQYIASDPLNFNIFAQFVLATMVMMGFIGGGFYWLIKSDLKKEKKKDITDEARAIIKSSQEVELSDDGILAASSIFIGLIGLEFFAKKVAPRYVVGVNRGGWLLSTYLVNRLKMDKGSLLEFDSGDCKGLLSQVNFQKNDSILLIDDISRTGEALEFARNQLLEKFPGIKLSIAVLVMVREGNRVRDYMDCYPYYTTTPNIALPWSLDERKKEAREKNKGNEMAKRSTPMGEDILNAEPSIVKMSDKNDQDGISIVTKDAEIAIEFMERATAG